jgi:hypothetical protein
MYSHSFFSFFCSFYDGGREHPRFSETFRLDVRFTAMEGSVSAESFTVFGKNRHNSPHSPGGDVLFTPTVLKTNAYASPERKLLLYDA